MNNEVLVMSRCHTYDGPEWQAEREPLAATLKRAGVHSIAVDLEPFTRYFQDVAELSRLKAPAPPVIYPRFYYNDDYGVLQTYARA